MTLTEAMHEGEFIGELAMGVGFHVDSIVLKSGQDRDAGDVLGAIQAGTPTVAAGAAVSGSGGTVGNGAVGTWTADAGAMEGPWRLVVTSAASNLGNYDVLRPDGTLDGVGTVGTAYNGGINGTLADGSNDWVEDDYVPISVVYDGDDSAKKYVEWDPAATDGSQVVAGILVPNTDATSGDVTTRALMRGPAVVNANDLGWKASMTDANKALGTRQLLALGIKAA